MRAQPRGREGRAGPCPALPPDHMARTHDDACRGRAGWHERADHRRRIACSTRAVRSKSRTRACFRFPGRYVEVDKRTIMVGQMFVQYQIPKNKTRPYPVVMIHGGGQTASNFLGTPDGRRGWARRLRRQRLCRLRRRPVGARPLGIFRRQLRQDPKALGGKCRATLHRPGTQAALAAGRICTLNGPERGRREMPRSMPSMPARSRPSATRR